MRLSWISIPALIALSGSAQSLISAGLPLISSVEPGPGRVGDQLTALETNLGQDSVAALYLTDGSNDVKVVILEQSADEIRFRIREAWAFCAGDSHEGQRAEADRTAGEGRCRDRYGRVCAPERRVDRRARIGRSDLSRRAPTPRDGSFALWRNQGALR